MRQIVQRLNTVSTLSATVIRKKLKTPTFSFQNHNLPPSAKAANSLLPKLKRSSSSVLSIGTNKTFTSSRRSNIVQQSLGPINLRYYSTVEASAKTRKSDRNLHKIYVYSSIALLAAPLAIIPDWGSMHIVPDLFLTATLPVHFYIGCHHIINDYVPAPLVKPSTWTLWILTAGALIGFLSLNIQGQGIAQTLRSFWIKKDTRITE
eukprot:TRINITY_DN2491_c0_g1_i1.p1 TRINITY_DN2491_c0_g1~~TRINITY_DN2491_c0_g1_i1.p1  ORF type:complete len:206 (-),score=21.43 TRINITY_DN2491_c0_g1_i1:53-670(-)